MNWGVALALIPLLGLVALASYVDRVYQEIGKFLSREFQDNIDVFEILMSSSRRLSPNCT
jgi:putative hemolysin